MLRREGQVEPDAARVEKGERGEDLEETWWMRQIAGLDQPPRGLVDLKEELGEVFVRNLRPVDLDAFVHTDQVRRGIETRAVTRSGENARQGGCRRSLAVSPGNQDRGEGGLRVAKRRSQYPHMGEVELAAGGGGRGRGEFVAQSVKVIDRCSVGHAAILGEFGRSRLFGGA